MKNLIWLIIMLSLFSACSTIKGQSSYVEKYTAPQINVLEYKGVATDIINERCSETSYIYYIREKAVANIIKDITMDEVCEYNGNVLTECRCYYSALLFNVKSLKDSSERLSILRQEW